MLKKIKQLFSFNKIEWIKSSEIDNNQLFHISDCLLVKSRKYGKMLFTSEQVKYAKKRAEKIVKNIQ